MYIYLVGNNLYKLIQFHSSIFSGPTPQYKAEKRIINKLECGKCVKPVMARWLP